jgi:hypothetical protein
MEAVRLGYPCMDALRAANAETTMRKNAESKVRKAVDQEAEFGRRVTAAKQHVEIQIAAEGKAVLAEARLAERTLDAANAELWRISEEIKFAKLNISLSKSIEDERSCQRTLEQLDLQYKAAILDQKNATADCHSFYKHVWNISRNSQVSYPK